jgi:hypothetical protein
MESSSERQALPSCLQIIALAGRNGAGKSTALFELAKRVPPSNDKPLFENPFSGTVLEFCCNLLWGEFIAPRRASFSVLIRPYFENISAADQILQSPYQVQYDFPPRNLNLNFFEINFAQSLKRIAAQLFSMPYELFAGETEATRVERERCELPFLFNRRRMTLRQSLEFLGTEVFRGFTADIWIESWYQTVQQLVHQKITRTRDSSTVYVGVADLRFENELQFLQSICAECFCIYRKTSDLTLTESDKKSHVSRWNFLNFYTALIPLENSTKPEDLGQRLAFHLFGDALDEGIVLAQEAGWFGLKENEVLFHEFTSNRVRERWRTLVEANPQFARSYFSVVMLPLSNSK